MKNVREHWAGIQLGLQTDACNRGAALEADAIGEQQPKRTRSGAAAEADASGERAAAAEAGAISGSSSELEAGAISGSSSELEADANGEQRCSS